jgi:DNA topoisomerase
MNTLVIAEKKEVGEAIANAFSKMLNIPIQKKNGVNYVGGFTITALAGHVMKLKEWEEIDPELKKWTLERLPIYFDNWEKIPEKNNDFKMNKFNTAKALLKECDDVIHAGDVDDEGQSLVDEVLEYCKNKKPVKRILISDTNADNIIKQYKKMESNDKYLLLGKAAYARNMADNVFGKNLTRFFTLKNDRAMVNVGRVKIPTLGFVVERDLEIENFVKKHYFNINAVSNLGNLTYAPKDEDSLKDEKEANDMINTIKSKVGDTLHCTVTKKKRVVEPELPYNLNKMQKDAEVKYGYSPEETLQIAEKLRLEKKLITYNRSDTRYLPVAYFTEAPAIIANAISNLKKLNIAINESVVKYDKDKMPKCFNDSEVEIHHGIIPTMATVTSLTEDENNIYNLVCRRYLMQFCEGAEFEDTKVESTFNVEFDSDTREIKFIGKSNKLLKAGWKNINNVDDEETEDEETGFSTLPVGNADLKISEFKPEAKETKPPARWTQASLVDDGMCKVVKFVKDPEIKKIMKDKNGMIGTPATQSKIVEDLIKEGYLKVEKKKLISTPKGRELYLALPEKAKSIDNTAKWWVKQEEIKKGQATEKDLLKMVVEDIKVIMNETKFFEVKSAKEEKAKADAKKGFKPKSNNGGSNGAQETDMICPITKLPLVAMPTKKDPSKLWYFPKGHNGEPKIGYMMSFDGSKLYELNSKKNYDIIKK